jgi:hypothetical protein
MKQRTEKDSLGERQVPADAYYGIQTQRAIDNYPIIAPTRCSSNLSAASKKPPRSPISSSNSFPKKSPPPSSAPPTKSSPEN